MIFIKINNNNGYIGKKETKRRNPCRVRGGYYKKVIEIQNKYYGGENEKEKI